MQWPRHIAIKNSVLKSVSFQHSYITEFMNGYYKAQRAVKTITILLIPSVQQKKMNQIGN